MALSAKPGDDLRTLDDDQLRAAAREYGLDYAWYDDGWTLEAEIRERAPDARAAFRAYQVAADADRQADVTDTSPAVAALDEHYKTTISRWLGDVGHPSLEGLLGGDHGLSAEQVTRLKRIANEINRRFPAEGDQEARDVILALACRAAVGDEAVIDELAADLADARQASWRATSTLKLVAPLLVEPHGPIAEAAFAQRVGINVRTAKSWLGTW